MITRCGNCTVSHTTNAPINHTTKPTTTQPVTYMTGAIWPQASLQVRRTYCQQTVYRSSSRPWFQPGARWNRPGADPSVARCQPQAVENTIQRGWHMYRKHKTTHSFVAPNCFPSFSFGLPGGPQFSCFFPWATLGGSGLVDGLFPVAPVRVAPGLS